MSEAITPVGPAVKRARVSVSRERDASPARFNLALSIHSVGAFDLVVATIGMILTADEPLVTRVSQNHLRSTFIDDWEYPCYEVQMTFNNQPIRDLLAETLRYEFPGETWNFVDEETKEKIPYVSVRTRNYTARDWRTYAPELTCTCFSSANTSLETSWFESQLAKMMKTAKTMPLETTAFWAWVKEDPEWKKAYNNK